jgi:hypothetical protein
MAYRLITAAALLLGSAAFRAELTRDGTIKQHTDAKPRYNADTCFKKAGVSSFISSNRKYWIHPKRRPSTSYSYLECPLARLPHSSYAYRSPGHRHLPGGPDLGNAILLQFLARVNK